MPLWNAPPPEHGRSVPYRLVRVPAKGIIKGAVTSDAPLGCPTHFVAHRTIPCEGPDNCPSCQAGHSWRWHCYIGLILGQTYEHVILELTAVGADPVQNYYRLHATLRACLLVASRPSARPNGRVIVTLQPPTSQHIAIPDEPDLIKILSHIWGLKAPDPSYPGYAVLKHPLRFPVAGNGDDAAQPR